MIPALKNSDVFSPSAAILKRVKDHCAFINTALHVWLGKVARPQLTVASALI